MKKYILLVWLLFTTLVVFGYGEKSKVVLSIEGENYYIHTIESGQTVLDIAMLYRVDEDDIYIANSQIDVENFVEGALLRIPCNERIKRLAPSRNDDKYLRCRVKEGTFYQVIKNFGISLDVIIRDNPGIDITKIKDGRVINVRYSAMEKIDDNELFLQLKKYANWLTYFSGEYVYRIVGEGDTLESLSKRFSVESKYDLIDRYLNTQLTEGMVLRFLNMYDETVMYAEDNYERGIVAEAQTYSGEGDMNVAMLLPLTDGSQKVRGFFVDFYHGALLALLDIKSEGYPIILNLYDTQDSVDATTEIIANAEFQKSNLVIGPVYEKNIGLVAEFARDNQVAMVSPLAMAEDCHGKVFYQIAPSISSKYDKMLDIFTPEKNIMFVYTPSTDRDLEQEMFNMVNTLAYSKIVFDNTFAVDTLAGFTIENAMTTDNNLFVVLSDNEQEVDRVLANISSVMNTRASRYVGGRVPVEVVGSSKWSRYRNLDVNLLFKLNVSFVTTYHVDRGSEAVKNFDKRYLTQFGKRPSLYAYRGYDVTKLFTYTQLLYNEQGYTEGLNDVQIDLLQVPYSFEIEDGNNVNNQWALVSYKHNYTIEVK